MPLNLLILISALVTACISGIFGMAGGMIFMAVILVYLNVAEAMVVHGIVQSFSNFSRFMILRQNIRWDIIGYKLAGAIPIIMVLALLSFQPEKRWVYLALGLLPFVLWIPKGFLHRDAQKPKDAIFCGALVIALNISAGVAGPALDFFYVKTELTRLQIVATKAVTMFAAHLVKIFYFGIPLVQQFGTDSLPPLWVFAVALPCVVIGTFLGTQILQKLDDINFKYYTKYLVTLIGFYYLAKAFSLI